MTNSANACRASDGQLSVREQQALHTYKALLESLFLAEDMKALVTQGLQKDPGPDQRRALDTQSLALAERIARIDATMAALIARASALTLPYPHQVEEIATLTAEVGQLARQGAPVAGTLELGARVLNFAAAIRFG